MKELSKTYEPSQVEGQIYQMWMDNDCFKANPDPDKKPYSIVMPPPNVTGQLHMGHALDSTLQDILTRYKRMEGYSALWLPVSLAGIVLDDCLRYRWFGEERPRYNLGLTRKWRWSVRL